MKNFVPNALAGSASPYLLQHAFNPVNWFPWSRSVIDQAKRDNKLLVISIGYSACHWCHVMEHESFEDDEVAAVMNRGFISIKVDREERPDIDQVYMDAVQLMTGRGGWPLNVIALPDGRPIYGGTYFPKENWLDVLRQVERMYREDPERCEQYGSELSMGMNRINQRFLNPPDDNQQGVSHPDMISRWKQLFDTMEGGSDRVPKFPMPDSYRYLLAYGVGFNDRDVVHHVQHTLNKMAFGGIYDQIGGGFARYSTDEHWKVPHFEKMLYDNALLISLYADAYRQSKEPLYENIIRQTIDFVCRELQSPTGGFYSALDADSEGVEGKYYCWKPEEFTFLNAGDRALALDYFNIGPRGFWEHGMYIPLRVDSDAEIAKRHGLDSGQLTENINRIRNAMLEVREQRVKPGLDDKILCSWNAMMLTACLDAYTATGYTPAFEMAMRNLAFIRNYFLAKDNKHLWHCAKIRADQVEQSVEAFLEDYAFCIEAFLHTFYATCELDLLQLAINLADTVLEEFKDTETGLFFFTGVHQETVLMRKPEVGDNVIPSSNAVMAHQFSRLYRITGLKRFDGIAEHMLGVMQHDVSNQAPWFSRWARLHLELCHEEEIVVAGPEAIKACQSLQAAYKPLTLMCGITIPSSHALFSGRISGDATRYFVCREKSCSKPFSQLSEALSAAPFPR